MKQAARVINFDCAANFFGENKVFRAAESKTNAVQTFKQMRVAVDLGESYTQEQASLAWYLESNQGNEN